MKRAAEAVIIRTGTANLASVLAALDRAGVAGRLAGSPDEVSEAAAVVLPGVGSFGAAMARLEADGMVARLRQRIEAGRPLLAVCLGLQLLAEESEESPGVAGLGVFPGRVTLIGGPVRVPQMGWNRVEPDGACRLLVPGHAYFANSYRLENAPAGWSAARVDHGGWWVAALERGSQLACQFHPELSGAWGGRLLAGWLARALAEGRAAC